MSQAFHSSHEVFISYASADKVWADAACAELEAHRIRCWIAPRDITAGREWGEAIIAALDGCKIMVLIFSAKANQSPQVRREVERAVSKGLIVLPCRIENVAPVGSMEFSLSNTHWLDAYTPPVERQIQRLARTVQTLLPEGRGAGQPGPPRKAPSTSQSGPTREVNTPGASRPSRRRGLRTIAGVVLGVIALYIGFDRLQAWRANSEYRLKDSRGSRESFTKVNVGMTLKEVEEILGPSRQTALITDGDDYDMVLGDEMTAGFLGLFKEGTLRRSWKKAILEGRVRHWGARQFIFAAFDKEPSGEGKIEAVWRQPDSVGSSFVQMPVLKPVDKWILSKDNFLKLKVGMTLKQLEEILGVGEPAKCPALPGQDDTWERAGNENRVYEWTGGDPNSNWMVLRAGFPESPSVAPSISVEALEFHSKSWDETKGALSVAKK